MAAIDKIYGNHAQWVQLRDWLKENEKPIRQECGSLMTWCDIEDVQMEVVDYKWRLPSSSLYPEPPKDAEYTALSSFSHEVDRWLIKECPLDFVRSALKEQYPNQDI